MSSQTNNRQLIVITGSREECQACASLITQNIETLLLKEPNKANDYLGQEFDAVIFNSFDGLSANAFGAVAGMIRAGGFLILLKPEGFPNDSFFLERFNKRLNTAGNVSFINPLANNEALPKLDKKTFSVPYATRDQSNAVEAILHVVKGHRRRPLVITADRGRGKSASLGLAVANLLKDGYKNIIVCAPSKKAAAVIFQYAEIEAPNKNLTFYSPDELKQKLPKADLVLIDEAAAIPVPLLVQYLKHYSRIVFSSTQHGYEGSGRGFSINFRKVLDSVAPEWKACKLDTPIRWNENDPLEQFVFDVLLLNAEPINNSLVTTASLENCQYTVINKKDLLEDNDQLKSLFGLLVGAHYQTKPSDLVQLLDDESTTIHTLQFNNKIIAVVLLIKEGGISHELSQQIFAGTRRLKGHLVAQSLAANMGIVDGPVLSGERISRIAVHPALQQQGFGSNLLEQVAKLSEADYLSTSFGATLAVMKFWQKANFKPVYLGMKRDACSGTHSVVMLYAKGQKGGEVCKIAQQRFAEHFPYLLSEPFQNLETDIALALLIALENPEILTDKKMKELNAFAYKQRGYENSIYPLWKLVCDKLPTANNLSEAEKEILLYKVLQRYSWQNIAQKMVKITGKKEALALLRKAVGKLL